MNYRALLTLMSIACSMLAGCVMGIPDSGPAPARPPEPCEIVITVEPEHVRKCMSRARWERDYRPQL